MSPVPSSFSRPPMRWRSPGVPGMAHGRARFSSRRYGRNSVPAFGPVANPGSIVGSVSASGMSHGYEEFERNVSESRITGVRIAVKYRTPVILLSHTFLSNSSEPWLIPDADTLPTIDPGFATGPNAGTEFLPYLRDENLARPWAIPGTPGLRHRIGGLEKEDGTGDISYEPENHERMTELRAAKVAGIAKDIPALSEDDPDGDAKLLVLGWGSTWGTIRAAARRVRDQGKKVATAHLFHLNPFPSNIAEVVRRYPKVLIPEMNSGQLALLIRGRFLVDATSYSKVQGLPIFVEDLEQEILKVMAE